MPVRVYDIYAYKTALHDAGGKSDLPIKSVRRITCDASIITVTEDMQGNPLNAGRKKRVVSLLQFQRLRQ
ncbi:MAG: hypothetical protein ACI82A_004400 [Candidatus Azotimanducaceae bacterium]